MALLFAGYLAEVSHGRADEVKGVEELLAGALKTLRCMEDRAEADRGLGVPVRPEPPGGYVGLGSRIWAWLVLERMGVAGDLDRAVGLAGLMAEAVAEDEMYDLLIGRSGAIVPLLALASRTGEQRWASVACTIGEELLGAATVSGDLAYWVNPRWPAPLGGFAHGASGIGWALSRLARATGREDFAAAAEGTVRYEDSLWDNDLGGWRDLRTTGFAAGAWCHGSAGIGLAAAEDLAVPRNREALRRAAAATWTIGMGWTHTLCHGDLGNWELLDVALAHGFGPPGLDRDTLTARILGSLERHGAVGGMARDAFTPGLLNGIGGIAYQLLRMHPECELPSVLVL
jgi:lantibiotic modifying enzyme